MKVEICQLSEQDFAPYGSYLIPSEYDDKKSTISFYADKLVGISEFSNMPSMSVLAFDKRVFIIDTTEMHEHTEEIFGGYNTDVLFHVAENTGPLPDPAKFKVFILPKGGFIRVKRKIWHYVPFVINEGRSVGIVILPPVTYSHDCVVVKLEEKIEINISN